VRENAKKTNLAEELLEVFAFLDLVWTLDTTLANRLLEELGHLEANLEQLALLLVLFTEKRARSRSAPASLRPTAPRLTSLNLSVKVDGSMLGKSFRATGRRSSINGMMRKTEKGIKRSRS
jgi:hypothetical protein